MRLPLQFMHRPATGPDPWLLLLLHGVGSNEADMFDLAPSLPSNVHVLSLRAPYEIDQGAYGWFGIHRTDDGQRRIDALQERESRFLVGDQAQSAARQLGVPAERVIVGGFSQGGIMALSVLLTYPQRLRGAMVLHGRLLPEVVPDVAPSGAFAGKALWVSHGSADRIMPPPDAQAIRAMASTLPLELGGADFPGGHELLSAEWAQALRWLGSLGA